MYSFGMFLYELVTGGTRPFEDLRFRHELDAAVMKGRALDPITSCDCPPWPDVADLIAHCLEHQPNRRATAEQVMPATLYHSVHSGQTLRHFWSFRALKFESVKSFTSATFV